MTVSGPTLSIELYVVGWLTVTLLLLGTSVAYLFIYNLEETKSLRTIQTQVTTLCIGQSLNVTVSGPTLSIELYVVGWLTVTLLLLGTSVAYLFIYNLEETKSLRTIQTHQI